MTKEIRRIDFEEFAAQLPALFEDMAREDDIVVVDKEGILFRIETTTEAVKESGRKHDPERVRRMLARTAGGWKGIDRQALMKDIHEGRQQSSRGRPA